MKLTFVGTSHGAPSAERMCSCIMIESGNGIYFVDAGAPMVDAVLKKGREMKCLKAVFTTHSHSDHTIGLPHLAGLVNWFYPDTAVDIYVTEQSLINAVTALMVAGGDGEPDADRVRFKIPSAGVVYEDENLKVEYIPTKHSSKCVSYAILVSEGEKRVLFGGDFSQDLKRRDVPREIGEELDGFVCELAHFKLPQIAPYLSRCRAKRVFFNHVYPLSNYEDVERAKKDYPFDIFTPDDGFEIEI